MKKLTLLIITLVLLSACRYKDLCYDHNHDTDHNVSLKLSLDIDLDVDLEVSVEAHTKIDTPSLMKINFYEPVKGNLSETEYTGPTGGPIHVNPGQYRMVIYSFDTEWTDIRGESNINTLEAFTSDVTDLKWKQFANFAKGINREQAAPIIYTPDHVLVTQKDVEIPAYSTEGEYVITITATAATILETYGFEVKNIEGIEYIASVDAFITNQARSHYFGRGERSSDSATIYFPMEVDKEKKTLKTTFNTFGKLPGESRSLLHILLIDSDGNEFTLTTDITDQFTHTDHEIIITDSIVIPKPEGGGGIDPSVDDWENHDEDVNIG